MTTAGPGPDAVLRRYAEAVRTADPEHFGGCWAPDAVWDLAGTVVTGPPAIVERFVRARTALRACTQTVVAGRWTTRAPDRAEGRWVVLEDQESAEGATRLVGVYHDEVVRTDAGWCFSRRRFAPVWRGSPRAVRPLVADARVCCSGTLGDAPLLHKIAAAATAGFDGISVYAREVDALAVDGWSVAELAAVCAGVGLAVAEVDGRSAWAGLPGESGPPVDHLLEIGGALSARSVTLLVPPGADLAPAGTRRSVAGALAAVGASAAARGLLVHLEPFAWSGLGDLATAADLVDRSGAANAGVLVDTWHLVVGPDRGRLPDGLAGLQVLGIQLGEAADPDPVDPRWSGMHDRRLPGPVAAAVLEQLRSRGCAAPVGVEVFSDALRAEHPRTVAARAFAALASTIPVTGDGSREPGRLSPPGTSAGGPTG